MADPCHVAGVPAEDARGDHVPDRFRDRLPALEGEGVAPPDEPGVGFDPYQAEVEHSPVQETDLAIR